MPELPLNLLRIMTALVTVAGAWLLWRSARAGHVGPLRTGALASLLAAAALFALVAPFIIYDHVLTTSTSAAVAWGLPVAGAFASVALLIAALIGDQSRGRRRCPKCWYDMSGAPAGVAAALSCPECGHDAAREHNLFRARRDRRHLAAAFLPLAAGAAGLTLWLNSQARWVGEAPTPVLSILSPWGELGDQLHDELTDRMSDQPVNNPLASDRERALQALCSRFALRIRRDPDALLYHVALLHALNETNDRAVRTMVRIIRSDRAPSARKAVDVLGQLARDSSAAQEALAELLGVRELHHLRSSAVIGLCNAKLDHRGGALPPGLVEYASGPNMTPPALNLLGLYSPAPESRALLIDVARRDSGWTSASAVSALTNLYPDDPEVHALVVAELAKTPRPTEVSIVTLLRWHDAAAARAGPTTFDRRRSLYSPAVRRALIDAIAKSPAQDNAASVDSWPVAKEVLTPEEKAELNHLWNRDGG